MKRFTRILAMALILAVSAPVCGCGGTKAKEKVSLIVRVPPIGLGNVPGIGEAEIYDLFFAAAEKFERAYTAYDVSIDIGRYFYLDEQEQLADKYGTPDAADIYYSGSYNTPSYAAKGWLAPLDDVVDETLRADVDEEIWAQNTIGGKVFVLPFQQFQNTLMVNRSMMEAAGLHDYIPADGAVAQWSTDTFDRVFSALKASLAGEENKFVFMMYAKNNQGDNHIMTLLRAFGCPLYGEDGNFAVDSPEGVRALRWIRELRDDGIIPKGAENLDLLACIGLFNNGQLAICVGNLSNLNDAAAKGQDVFLANFPSPDGKGYATSSSNGFCVFDNGDEKKLRVSKDFIRFIFRDEELMRYTLGTLPVSRSVTEKYQDEIPFLKAYGDNVGNVVDNIRNNLNWEGVRAAFYPNIRDLLLGYKTPEQAAAAIDADCNRALESGRAILSPNTGP